MENDEQLGLPGLESVGFWYFCTFGEVWLASFALSAYLGDSGAAAMGRFGGGLPVTSQNSRLGSDVGQLPPTTVWICTVALQRRSRV